MKKKYTKIVGIVFAICYVLAAQFAVTAHIPLARAFTSTGANGTSVASTGGCDTSLDPVASMFKVQYCSLNDFILHAIQYVFLILGMVAVAMIVYGGFRYLTSAGGEDGIKSGKKTLTYAIIGLIVILLAYTIVGVVTRSVADFGSSTANTGTGSNGTPCTSNCGINSGTGSNGQTVSPTGTGSNGTPVTPNGGSGGTGSNGQTVSPTGTGANGTSVTPDPNASASPSAPTPSNGTTPVINANGSANGESCMSSPSCSSNCCFHKDPNNPNSGTCEDQSILDSGQGSCY